MCINHILFVHSSNNGYLDCFHLLAIVSSAVVDTVCKNVFKILFSILLEIHSELGLLDAVVHLFYFFEDPPSYFP